MKDFVAVRTPHDFHDFNYITHTVYTLYAFNHSIMFDLKTY